MRLEEITCDECKKQNKVGDHSWFALNNLKMLGGAPPKLDREVHLCGTSCLRDWAIKATGEIDDFNSRPHQSPLGEVRAQRLPELILH
ncbi:MAG TPA: hypothetical protein VJJ24_03065 [Candidatus Paceibacterota bacterium]